MHAAWWVLLLLGCAAARAEIVELQGEHACPEYSRLHHGRTHTSGQVVSLCICNGGFACAGSQCHTHADARARRMVHGFELLVCSDCRCTTQDGAVDSLLAPPSLFTPEQDADTNAQWRECLSGRQGNPGDCRKAMAARLGKAQWPQLQNYLVGRQRGLISSTGATNAGVGNQLFFIVRLLILALESNWAMPAIPCRSEYSRNTFWRFYCIDVEE